MVLRHRSADALRSKATPAILSPLIRTSEIIHRILLEEKAERSGLGVRQCSGFRKLIAIYVGCSLQRLIFPRIRNSKQRGNLSMFKKIVCLLTRRCLWRPRFPPGCALEANRSAVKVG